MLCTLVPQDGREWQATVGLDYQRFTTLCELAQVAFFELRGKTFAQMLAACPQPGPIRLTSLTDLLFYTLFVLKSGITFDVAGFLMPFDQSRAHRQFTRGVRLLHYVLEVEGYLPVRSIASVAEFAQLFAEVDPLIIDATEQPIQRPQDREYQKECYSGKKKHHTCKAMIISSLERYIHYVSNSYTGNSHDYSLLKAEFDPELPWFAGCTVRVDLGYVGFATDYPEAKLYLPTKKPRGGKLTPEQKAANRELARERITVEHSMGGIKRYDILSGTSRLRDIDTYDMVLGVCAGRWNFFITR